MMNSQQGFDSKDRDIQDLLKTIIEKNKGGSDNKFDSILKNLPSVGEKTENFLRENRPTYLDFMGGPQQPPVEFMGGPQQPPVEFMGGPQMGMHDYQKDPELIKTLQEIINTPGYDRDSVREAQRQMLRIRQGLPRFPTA